MNAGPAAVVQNNVMTYIQSYSAYAESVGATNTSVTGQSPDDSFSFIGNVVTGERQGMSTLIAVRPGKVTVSGNTFALGDPLNVTGDHPAGGDYILSCQRALISGNTLTSGGWGFASVGSTTNVVLLKNDYSGAHFQGVADYNGLGLSGPDQSLESVAVVKNIIGSGAGSHHRAIYPAGAHWFMIGNEYRGWPDSSVVVTNVLVEPLAQPIHFQH